jgi:hypothetical protein
MFLNRLVTKHRLSSLLFMVVLMLTMSLSIFTAPSANAACPINGCNPGGDPPDSLPIPKTRDVIFHVWDQDFTVFKVEWLKLTYYTVSNNQYVQQSRTAYPINQYNPPLQNFYQMYGDYGYFRTVKLATNKPATITAYGRYNNGQYAYKTATIQYEVPVNNYNYCRKWRAYADNSTIMAKGFYPLPECP